jgi:hypothetical protein
VGNRIDFDGSVLHQAAAVSRFKLLLNSKPVPSDVPQSYKTLTEPVSFDNPNALALPLTYVPFFESVVESVVESIIESIVEGKVLDPSWKLEVASGYPACQAMFNTKKSPEFNRGQVNHNRLINAYKDSRKRNTDC